MVSMFCLIGSHLSNQRWHGLNVLSQRVTTLGHVGLGFGSWWHLWLQWRSTRAAVSSLLIRWWVCAMAFGFDCSNGGVKEAGMALGVGGGGQFGHRLRGRLAYFKFFFFIIFVFLLLWMCLWWWWCCWGQGGCCDVEWCWWGWGWIFFFFFLELFDI